MKVSDFKKAIEDAKSEDAFMFAEIQLASGPQEDLEDECMKFEASFGAELPLDYKWFLVRSRSSAFGYAEIMVLEKGSALPLGGEVVPYAPDGFVPICDTGTGDHYGIMLNDQGDGPIFYFDHDSASCTKTRFATFFEFAVSAGLNNTWQ